MWHYQTRQENDGYWYWRLRNAEEDVSLEPGSSLQGLATKRKAEEAAVKKAATLKLQLPDDQTCLHRYIIQMRPLQMEPEGVEPLLACQECPRKWDTLKEFEEDFGPRRLAPGSKIVEEGGVYRLEGFGQLPPSAIAYIACGEWSRLPDLAEYRIQFFLWYFWAGMDTR